MSENQKEQNAQPQTETPPPTDSETVVDQTNPDDPEVNADNIDDLLSDLAESMDESDESEIAAENIEQPSPQDPQAQSNDPPSTAENPTGDSSPHNEDDGPQVDQALMKLEEELNDLIKKEDPDLTDQKNSEQPSNQPIQGDAPTEQDIDTLLDQMSNELDDPEESITQTESASTADAQANIQEADNPAQQGDLDQTLETAGTDSPSPGDDSETLVQAPGKQTQPTDEQEIQSDPQDPKAENAEAFSFPVRVLLKILQIVNKPFGFVNQSTRQIIGLVAVITFMMTMITVALMLLAS